jgi:hypothetical protein
MERECAARSLHQRVTDALVRGARTQEESRALIATTRAIHARMEVTRAAVDQAREQRARARTFAFGQDDDQNRGPSG